MNEETKFIINDKEKDILNEGAEYTFYFVSSKGRRMHDDKAMLVASNLCVPRIKTCAIRVGFELCESANLYNELKNLDTNTFRVVYFCHETNKIFTIEDDAKLVLMTYLEKNHKDKILDQSSDLLMHVIDICDESLGIYLHEVSDFE